MSNKKTDEIISVLNLFLDEWKHRDSILWKITFTFFISILTVSLLPFMASYWQINLNDKIPACIFPLIGLILTIIFFFVSKGYALRLSAISNSYQKTLKLLPEEYKYTKIKDLKHRSLKAPLSTELSFLIVYLMSTLLFLVCVTLIFISLYPCYKNFFLYIITNLKLQQHKFCARLVI